MDLQEIEIWEPCAQFLSRVSTLCRALLAPLSMGSPKKEYEHGFQDGSHRSSHKLSTIGLFENMQC